MESLEECCRRRPHQILYFIECVANTRELFQKNISGARKFHFFLPGSAKKRVDRHEGHLEAFLGTFSPNDALRRIEMAFCNGQIYIARDLFLLWRVGNRIQLPDPRRRLGVAADQAKERLTCF
jgi:hypothetical protein